MWYLHEPGLEPVSPALAGGFLTTASPGKSTSSAFQPQPHHQIPLSIHSVHSSELPIPFSTPSIHGTQLPSVHYGLGVELEGDTELEKKAPVLHNMNASFHSCARQDDRCQHEVPSIKSLLRRLCPSLRVVLNLECTSQFSAGPVKTQIAEPIPEILVLWEPENLHL